jgi:peptidoglycan biosynthesis protein MviN/MurJ (putative lipid II flippase)
MMRTHDDDALRAKHAQAGMAMAVATFTMAAASAAQAALYLHSFGINGRTDGFFVAFALYTVFGVFSQSIRVSSAPLLVGAERTLSVREFAATLAVLAVPVAIATIPLAHPLALLLAPGLSEADRAVTQHALPILGCTMVLQLWAAGAATVLAVRDRFKSVAGAYMVGAGAGLATYVAVVGATDELSMAWSMLAMMTVTCVFMFAGLRGGGEETAPSRPLRPARLVANAASILGRTAVYLAFNALYLVTLAFTSSFEPGDATVLSYAYVFASYLVAGTAFALGMSRIADMRRGTLAEWRTVVGDTVPHGFRYSMLLVAPAMAGLVAAGASIVGDVFSASLTHQDVRTLRLFAALLAAWTVAALLVNLLLPAMFALGREWMVNILALPLLALHVAATAIGGVIAGAPGVVGASFVAPLCFAGVLLFIGAGDIRGHLARELTRDGLRIALPAAGSYAVGVAIGASVANGLLEAVIAGAVGTILYGVIAISTAAPQQVRRVIRSVRPESRVAAANAGRAAS